MIVLAIESSGAVASAAILDNGKVLAFEQGPFKVTHSETLMPLVSRAFAIAGIKKESIDAIAVSAGPGSFTGLRIGSATAKGIAQALDLPIVEVSSLEAMAFALHGTDRLSAIAFILPLPATEISAVIRNCKKNVPHACSCLLFVIIIT